MKKRKFWKKFVVCLCVISSLLVFNFSMFSLNASANAYMSLTDVYTIGAPYSLEFESDPSSGGSGSFYSGSISMFNVYSAVYSDSFRQEDFRWYGSLYNNNSGSLNNLYSFYYRDDYVENAALIFNFLNSRRALISFSLESPVVFKNRSDLEKNFAFYFTLQGLSSGLGNSIDSVSISYDYIFADYNDGEISIKPISQIVTYSLSSNQISLSNFNYSVLTDSLLSEVDQFYNPFDGDSYRILLNAKISVLDAVCSSFYVDTSYTGSVVQYVDYQTLVSSRLLGVLDADYIQENVSFENISWTGWLVNAVGGFLDFQIVPGLSFAGMLGLLVGMSLFIVFLKVFSGG